MLLHDRGVNTEVLGEVDLELWLFRHNLPRVPPRIRSLKIEARGPYSAPPSSFARVRASSVKKRSSRSPGLIQPSPSNAPNESSSSTMRRFLSSASVSGSEGKPPSGF